MKANKILHDISIAKIWDKLLKHEDDMSNLSNPNLLINGDFQVWQRGETVSISNDANRHYTCDRWAVNSVYVIVSKVVNGLKFDLLNAEVDYIYQAMERPLKAGEEYTVSYSLNDTIKTKTFVGGQYFDFDAGNGIRYSTVNGYEAIFVQLHKDDILNWVKLEQGSIATPFIPRLYAEELALCQRYYQHHRNIWARRISANVAKYRLMDVMRVEPTLSGTFTLWTLENSQKETLPISALYTQINCIDIFKNDASYEWHVRCEDAYLDAEIY